MLAVKVFAEGVAEQIKAYLPPEYESVTCSVKEQNKTNGVMQVGNSGRYAGTRRFSDCLYGIVLQ